MRQAGEGTRILGTKDDCCSNLIKLAVPQLSQSLEQLRNVIVVIVIMCAAFALTASEAKIEIFSSRTRGLPDATTTFIVEAADQVYKLAHIF